MLDPDQPQQPDHPRGHARRRVYAAIDKKVGVKAGTTRPPPGRSAKNLGLPAWARRQQDIKDPLEGFLFPASYSVAKGMKPADVLQQMVTRPTRSTASRIWGRGEGAGPKSPLQ